MAPPNARHVVTVIVDHQTIGGWIEYEVTSSMIEPADGFRLRRPFSPEAYSILRRDARVRVLIDGVSILDGFIDDRTKRSREGTFEIEGRDRSGRLVQESAPRISYEGLELTEAIKKLADPWFTKVTLSDARNRKLRMGKAKNRVPAENEPIIVKRSAGGNGRVQPGTMRWSIIEELASQVGYIVWSSADGTELFVGQPNNNQPPTFHVLKARGGGRNSTCKDLITVESNGDRYSLIAVVGTGGSTEIDFGVAVSSRRAFVTDNEDNVVDGTGRDFQFPKRLMMPEKHFASVEEASREAAREQWRRDFRRLTYQAEMPFHGQWIVGSRPTLFAPNTVAMITDEDHVPTYEDDGMIYACTYRRNRQDGETTLLDMVPTGTAIVQ